MSDAWRVAPEAIYRQSFAMARAEAPLDGLPADLADVALRLVHAAGDAGVVADLAASPGAADAARRALAAGAPLLVDARMVAAGIDRARLPAGNDILCTLELGTVPALAAHLATTRAAAAVELWRPFLAGAVVVVGNAPTALARLLAGLDAGWPLPAAILGFPVGYVGAAEAKDALMARTLPAWIATRGRRGGSALAAAAVNALTRRADDEA
ncbi:MAG: precorrin-8X methylmutase [Alphaproteobacteria bacterium]